MQNHCKVCVVEVHYGISDKLEINFPLIILILVSPVSTHRHLHFLPKWALTCLHMGISVLPGLQIYVVKTEVRMDRGSYLHFYRSDI